MSTIERSLNAIKSELIFSLLYFSLHYIDVFPTKQTELKTIHSKLMRQIIYDHVNHKNANANQTQKIESSYQFILKQIKNINHNKVNFKFKRQSE